MSVTQRRFALTLFCWENFERLHRSRDALRCVTRKAAVSVSFGKTLTRFAKNLNHRFSRHAVLRPIVARGPPLADA